MLNIFTENPLILTTGIMAINTVIGDTVKIKTNQDGLNIHGFAPSKSMEVILNIGKEHFDKYELEPENLEMNFNISQLFKIMDRVRKTDKLSLFANKDGITIIIYNKETSERQFFIPYTEDEAETRKSIREGKTFNGIKAPYQIFDLYVKDAALESDTINIKTTDKHLIVSSAGKMGKVFNKFAHEIEDLKADKQELNFGMSTLRLLYPGGKFGGTMFISLDHELGAISFNRDYNCSLSYYFAPKVDEEE